ncbi:hypothetical protein MTR67_016543 [Solanum verrucosum]|uniref:Disease resistance R13L4/SHOC-2-like LRR domain-containing protein n=1 Tax=Solanum verrucosum TaxID=315347 RepID=A0AAF0QHE9_SOLVR|nr:hypothetical protein MTR67_016543 [Solanum verrucosum]
MFFDRKMSLINFSSVFQHLYVLYLEMCVDKNPQPHLVPDAIGSLYHLKFLRLRGRIHDLPTSIGNLKNLQTLVVNGYSCKLPQETADLINLRHLDARYSESLKHLSKLTSLQVLKGVYCDQWKDVDPVDLVNLRELTMCSIWNSYSLKNISSLKNLGTLRLFCERDELYTSPFPSLEFLYSCEKLQKLWLKGRVEKLPLFPNSITMMVLWQSRLMEDPMPILGKLPNLKDLILQEAYKGKEIIEIKYGGALQAYVKSYLIIAKPPISKLGQWQKREVKARGTSWDVKSGDLKWAGWIKYERVRKKGKESHMKETK